MIVPTYMHQIEPDKAGRPLYKLDAAHVLAGYDFPISGDRIARFKATHQGSTPPTVHDELDILEYFKTRGKA